jgi:hypothetical protein
LPAPTLFAFNTPTTTTLDFSFTSNSGGSESGFEVQISTDSGFSAIVQTVNLGSGVTSGQTTGLASGTLYYGRVRATGAIPSDWSNKASSATETQFETFANPFGFVRWTSIATKSHQLVRSSDNDVRELLLPDDPLTTPTTDMSQMMLDNGQTLADWVGSNDARIERVYIQSDEDNSWYAATDPSTRPYLVTAGVLEVDNDTGLPTMFSNGNARMQRTGASPTASWNLGTDWTSFTVAFNNAAADPVYISTRATNTDGSVRITRNQASTIELSLRNDSSVAANLNTSALKATNARELLVCFNDTSLSEASIWNDGNTGDQNISYSGTFSETESTLFYQSGASITGGISECLQDDSDVTADVNTIRTLMNSILSIY